MESRERYSPSYGAAGAVLAAAIVGLILYIVLSLLAIHFSPRVDMHSWMGRERAVKLMRYHGVTGLKITATEALIKRNGKWIVVERRGDGL